MPTAIDPQVRKLLTDPVEFAERLLRVRLWEGQKRILRAVAAHRRVAVKGCHASGKTFAIGSLVLWFVARFADSKVITTAPTFTQVQENIWAEIHAAREHALIDFPSAQKVKLTLSEANLAIGRATNKGLRFHGWHAPRMLIVIDEANGVEQPVYGAIDGIAAGGIVHQLATANPVETGGEFNDMFERKAELWHGITLSAFDTPNLAGLWMPGANGAIDGDPTGRCLLDLSSEELDANPWPSLCTRRWVAEYWVDCDRDPLHPGWMGRVLARFPVTSISKLFPEVLVDMVMARDIPAPDLPVVVGIDVAGPGDCETVAAARRGYVGIAMKAWKKPDPRAEVCEFLEGFGRDLGAVGVDVIGEGWYFYLHLKDKGFPVVPVNVAEKASDPDKYTIEKHERYFTFRNILREDPRARLPYDQQTRAQLIVLDRIERTDGRNEVESKDSLRKRGIDSPDRAEAWMICFTTRPVASAAQTAGDRASSLYVSDDDRARLYQTIDDYRL